MFVCLVSQCAMMVSIQVLHIYFLEFTKSTEVKCILELKHQSVSITVAKSILVKFLDIIIILNIFADITLVGKGL